MLRTVALAGKLDSTTGGRSSTVLYQQDKTLFSTLNIDNNMQNQKQQTLFKGNSYYFNVEIPSDPTLNDCKRILKLHFLHTTEGYTV